MSDIITNKEGGKQSKIQGQITEVPPLAILEVSKIMGEGRETYPRELDGSPNWYKIDYSSNLDHGLEHIFNFLGERNKAHRNPEVLREELGHAAARLLMSLEQYIRRESRGSSGEKERTLFDE